MIKKRHQNIPAVYLMLFKQGRILLLKRAHTGYEDGNYSLVAGHVDQGETFTQAMIREAFEEIGLFLKPEYLEVVHVMHRKSGHDQSERVDVFFVAAKWNGKIKNQEPEKCADLSWFEMEKIPQNTIPYVREVIENIKNKKIYSEYGW